LTASRLNSSEKVRRVRFPLLDIASSKADSRIFRRSPPVLGYRMMHTDRHPPGSGCSVSPQYFW
ncbi:hypothetical protein, partial [Mariniblastus fucicola]|uniref:hypothetical protein n=1 Tax=Mariniblastus fucicola TaxID=980251 RepID=UPI001EE44080